MMRRICSILLSVILLLLLCSCGQKQEAVQEPVEQSTSTPTPAPDWREQYDLGLRFLSEGNYQEAILAFTAAIEIDPKQTDLYLSLAEAYEKNGQTELALQTLEKAVGELGELAALTEALARLAPPVQTEVSDIRSVDLQLSDISYEFEEGGQIAQWNEGAVGGMTLHFTVSGPANVAAVRIATWREGAIPAAEVTREIDMMIEIWKEHEGGEIHGEPLPFTAGTGFPVDPEELGTKVEVLLIGIDSKGDYAGHAIVPVEIPAAG